MFLHPKICGETEDRSIEGENVFLGNFYLLQNWKEIQLDEPDKQKNRVIL